MRLQLGDRERVIFHEPPSNLDVWQEWLRRHGIDPNEVVLSWRGAPGWIERQEDTYRVAWLGPEWSSTKVVTRTVQLEGKPLPFPRWGDE